MPKGAHIYYTNGVAQSMSVCACIAPSWRHSPLPNVTPFHFPLSEHANDWDVHLPHLVMVGMLCERHADVTSYSHEHIRHSPHFLVYGRDHRRLIQFH